MDSNLVLLGVYNSDVDAHIAKGVLETHGIPAIIDNEVFSSVFPATLTPVGGLRLLVHRGDEDAARKVLADQQAD